MKGKRQPASARMKSRMDKAYQEWLNRVRESLSSINMGMDDWQEQWTFDFEREYSAGSSPEQAAARANRFWWKEQNRVIGDACEQSSLCWLPNNHQGECEPVN